MVEIYNRTVGEAYSAMISYIVTNALTAGDVLTYIAGGYTTFSGSTPGYFLLQISPPSTDVRFYIRESLLGVPLPLQYVVRQPGMGAGLVCNFPDPGGGVIGLTECFDAAFSNKLGAIANICSISGVPLGGGNFTFAGQPKPCTRASGFILYSADDVAVINDVGINQAFVPTGFEITTPAQMIFPVGQYLIPGSAGVTINNPPPLDVDVAINQGQAIFSVLSRTTTMIP